MTKPTKMLELLCAAASAFDRATSTRELRTELEVFAKRLEFDRFAYAVTINAPSLKRQQYFLSDYPTSWVSMYVERDYFKVDPLVRFAQKSTLPAIWDDDSLHNAETQEFWEEAGGFGLHCGLTFPVHDQPGITGVFSLARDRHLEMPEAELAALVGRAQMFATLLHQAVARIDLPKLIPETCAALTPRERECLRWAADGKTAWEIGQILNITERTAVFHVNNVTQKLGAVNKTQAIARAVVLKLL
ncbi:MAG TPA: LuxR family transcriptional regulator [Steroidobacteraceae bacterium]|nr:LuxR family transcriptional regulator [Steroidobacteraceae bacterium]